ncbi:MAG: S1 RNA-binding domain-containing protein [Candidatus Yonathbacteria bacterium]|nr:S1 RNA-binding domain-containing protein [Candidatus Yonathbacteria bacterium]NTW48054.1 S1 RNA-binding domain-containing protein [Candidatus Yonathbacteria bacterium]
MSTDEITNTDAVATEEILETTEQADNSNHPMTALVADSPAPPAIGDLVEGPVIAIERNAVFVDLAPFGTGTIYGRELLNARDVIRHTSIGDTITAKVVDAENENGYIELSLKEARQALIWTDAEDAIRKKTLLELTVKEANKGGLIMEWQGIAGFLPASQLSTDHYPRVEGGDKDKITNELRKLVGEKISVMILSANPKEGKLIFSEKDIADKDRTELAGRHAVGDVIEGPVTGIVDFGVFVKVEEGLEGLVHISEIDWGLVDDPKHFCKVGETAKAKIIEIKDGKVSLSIKALKDNPWKTAGEHFKKGDKVNGIVIKFNRHGALVSIEEGVAGLVHVSDFPSEEMLRKTLELAKTYPFEISLFEPKDQRMTLVYTGEKKDK